MRLFVILPQLTKVDWSGIANGVLSNLPGIIQASANAGKVGRITDLVFVASASRFSWFTAVN